MSHCQIWRHLRRRWMSSSSSVVLLACRSFLMDLHLTRSELQRRQRRNRRWADRRQVIVEAHNSREGSNSLLPSKVQHRMHCAASSIGCHSILDTQHQVAALVRSRRVALVFSRRRMPCHNDIQLMQHSMRVWGLPVPVQIRTAFALHLSRAAMVSCRRRQVAHAFRRRFMQLLPPFNLIHHSKCARMQHHFSLSFQLPWAATAACRRTVSTPRRCAVSMCR